MSQRQKPSLMCCVLTWRFHSFFDVKVDWQPYSASGQGNGRSRRAAMDFLDLVGLEMRDLVGDDDVVERLRVWEGRRVVGGRVRVDLGFRRLDLGLYSGSSSSSSSSSKRSLMESLIDSSLIDSPMPSSSV